jgi:transposase
MRQKSGPQGTAEQHVREIRRQTRKRHSTEEKIRIVLEGLRGEHSIAELCRREGIAQSLYYKWSKEFLEAGKKRLDDDPAKIPLRSKTVEHPFGTIRAWMGATHFKMKTMKRVATEMALHVLAYNMTRVIAILGVSGFMKAMRG